MPPTTLSDTIVKKTDLEKNKALKLIHNMKRTTLPVQAGGKPVDRREQRRLDQAQGLVPFAVKLNGELVKALHAEAQARQISVNALVSELLEKGLKG
ncbi:toxin-antitoxin system HicB family antitoxin [Imbroritus primus]|uniref:toxin-antitoxin system HicB family antitoxin n=1 Tax=Imbroritus primus TaxID=3058603 RepID=UPI003D16140D